MGIRADGIVDLGVDGLALVCRARAVTFSLRTFSRARGPRGRASPAFSTRSPSPSRSSSGPSPPISAPIIDALLGAAPELPHPALEAAARGHARFLAELAAHRDLLRREVLIVLRQASGDDASGRLHRRAAEAAAALGAAGVTLVVLDGPAAATCLARRSRPGRSRVRARRRGRDRRHRSPWPARRKTMWREQSLASHRRAPPPVRPRPSAPTAVEVGPRALRVGEGWCRSFAIVGYPREVGHGWLEPLTAHPSRLDVALHVEPVPAEIAADRLRRQLARLESGRRADAAKGRLADPEVEVAAADARELAAGLARGEQKLFRVGLYLTVHARSQTRSTPSAPGSERCAPRCCSTPSPPRGAFSRAGPPPCPLASTPWVSGAASTPTRWRRRFPSPRPGLSAETGVLYGTATNGSGLVLWDRFAQDNHNSVILARSGAGKSYLAKLEALRSLYAGIEIAVVDPEDEYRRLAETVGGAYVHLGAPGVRVNPFDLAPGPDPLIRRALFIHTLVAVLLGEKPDPAATAALDRGIVGAYESVGITADPRSHARPAPLLARPRQRARSRRRPRGAHAGRPPGAVRHRHAPGAVRRAHHHPSRWPPRRLLAARPARASSRRPGRCSPSTPSGDECRDPVEPQAPAGHRRRGVVAHVRPVGRRVPVSHGQVRPQALGRAHRRHPRRGRSASGRRSARPSSPTPPPRSCCARRPRPIDALAEAFALSAGERAYLLGAQPGPGPARRRASTGWRSAPWPAPPKTTLCRTGIEQTLDDTPDL